MKAWIAGLVALVLAGCIPAVAQEPEWLSDQDLAIREAYGVESWLEWRKTQEPQEGPQEARQGVATPLADWAFQMPARRALEAAGDGGGLTLADIRVPRPQVWQWAAVVPYWTGDEGGVMLMLQQAEAADPQAGHWDRHGPKYLTGTGVAAAALLAVNEGWIGGGDSKDKTPTVVVEAGRDAAVNIGSGNTSNQGDDIPPPPVPAAP